MDILIIQFTKTERDASDTELDTTVTTSATRCPRDFGRGMRCGAIVVISGLHSPMPCDAQNAYYHHETRYTFGPQISTAVYLIINKTTLIRAVIAKICAKMPRHYYEKYNMAITVVTALLLVIAVLLLTCTSDGTIHAVVQIADGVLSWIIYLWYELDIVASGTNEDLISSNVIRSYPLYNRLQARTSESKNSGTLPSRLRICILNVSSGIFIYIFLVVGKSTR